MSAPLRLVVLVSGSGTLLQALLDAQTAGTLPVQVVAVGADQECVGLERARAAGVATFVEAVRDHADRGAWDAALAARIAEHAPGLVVTAGFMKILGPQALAAATFVNTHPALLPAFPGLNTHARALAAMLLTLGALCPLLAFARWAMAERAMRRGEPLPSLGVSAAIVTGLVLVAAAALAVVVGTSR